MNRMYWGGALALALLAPMLAWSLDDEGPPDKPARKGADRKFDDAPPPGKVDDDDDDDAPPRERRGGGFRRSNDGPGDGPPRGPRRFDEDDRGFGGPPEKGERRDGPRGQGRPPGPPDRPPGPPDRPPGPPERGHGPDGHRPPHGHGPAGLQLPSPFPFQDDPEIAELRATDHNLERKSRELVHEFRKAQSNAEKEALRTKLNEVVNQHFDARQKVRKRTLAKMEEQLTRLKNTIEKREQKKSAHVERRVAELLGEEDPNF